MSANNKPRSSHSPSNYYPFGSYNPQQYAQPYYPENTSLPISQQPGGLQANTHQVLMYHHPGGGGPTPAEMTKQPAMQPHLVYNSHLQPQPRNITATGYAPNMTYLPQHHGYPHQVIVPTHPQFTHHNPAAYQVFRPVMHVSANGPQTANTNYMPPVQQRFFVPTGTPNYTAQHGSYTQQYQHAHQQPTPTPIYQTLQAVQEHPTSLSTSQPHHPKHRSHALQIIDPDTLLSVDIDERSSKDTTPSMSVDSSARHTPALVAEAPMPSPDNKELVAAEFATKVAAVINTELPRDDRGDTEITFIYPGEPVPDALHMTVPSDMPATLPQPNDMPDNSVDIDYNKVEGGESICEENVATPTEPHTDTAHNVQSISTEVYNVTNESTSSVPHEPSQMSDSISQYTDTNLYSSDTQYAEFSLPANTTEVPETGQSAHSVTDNFSIKSPDVAVEASICVEDNVVNEIIVSNNDLSTDGGQLSSDVSQADATKMESCLASTQDEPKIQTYVDLQIAADKRQAKGESPQREIAASKIAEVPAILRQDRGNRYEKSESKVDAKNDGKSTSKMSSKSEKSNKSNTSKGEKSDSKSSKRDKSGASNNKNDKSSKSANKSNQKSQKDSKTEAKNDVKTDKSNIKSDVKVDVKNDVKSSLKTDTKSDAKIVSSEIPDVKIVNKNEVDETANRVSKVIDAELVVSQVDDKTAYETPVTETIDRTELSPDYDQYYPAEETLDYPVTPDNVIKPIPVQIGNRQPGAPSMYGDDGFCPWSPTANTSYLGSDESPMFIPSSDPTVDLEAELEGKSTSRQKAKAKEAETSISTDATDQPTEPVPDTHLIQNTKSEVDDPNLEIPEPSNLNDVNEGIKTEVQSEIQSPSVELTNTQVHIKTEPTAQSDNSAENHIENVDLLSKKDVKVEYGSERSDESPMRETSTPSPAPLPTPTLKYAYKEDQWSPLNPEGKKQYDRDFLLRIQYAPESLQKPCNLPSMEIIMDKPLVHHGTQPLHSPVPSMDFAASMYTRQHSRGGHRGSREQNRMKYPPPQQQVISTIPADVKLNTVENAWKRGQIDTKKDNPEDTETEKIYKKVRSILNKLTPQKFEILVNQVSNLDITTEDRLTGVVKLIFEKAIDEPNFSVTYANMCKKLSVDSKINTKQFKTILLTNCQREYELDKKSEMDVEQRESKINEAATDAIKKQLREELALEMSKVKRRTLGNIRFIGELYKLKMLNDRVMHGCIQGLLRATEDEEKLECLCRLMKTIGKELDVPDHSKATMNSYFESMTKIVEARKISSRIRFMLQDTIELRKDKWIPRREENNPKTIDEVHKEIKQEEQRKMIHQQAMKHNSKPLRPLNQSGGRDGSNEWQKPSRPVMDATKIFKFGNANKDRASHDNVQLGPPKSWVRGATTSNKIAEPEKPIQERNRFNVLSQDDDPKSRSMGRSPARSDSRSYGSSYGRDSQGRESQVFGGHSGRNSGPRSSMERERENALASVKSFRSRASNDPPSRSDSRESSSSRTTTPTIPEKAMSAELVAKKSETIIDEYLSSHILEEAVDLAKALNPTHLDRFVSVGINKVIEHSHVAQHNLAKLLLELIRSNVLPISSYIAGVNDVMEIAIDLAVDAPKIWEYLGRIIGPVVLDKAVPLADLRGSILMAEHKAGELMSEILHYCAQIKGTDVVAALWKESGFHWQDFLPPTIELQEFLRKKKLEFTVADNRHKSKTSDLQVIQTGLSNLLAKLSDNETIFSWIEENVSAETQCDLSFINALMTEVCRSVLVETKTETNKFTQLNKEEFSRRNLDALLLKYLDHKADRELHAIIALQLLMERLSFPSGVLQSLFDLLYDEDVISEDAFKQWRLHKDEPRGKAVAESQVIQFFTSLDETS